MSAHEIDGVEPEVRTKLESERVVPASGAGNPDHPGLARHRSAAAAEARLVDQKAGYRTDLVVVGVDSSLGSSDATWWAAAQASRRHATLRLVHAIESDASETPGVAAMRSTVQTRAADEELLSELGTALRDSFPELGVDTRLVPGDPATTLREESAHARLTVVGANGSGLTAGPALGSVASAVSTANSAPVSVIHPHHRSADRGPVVVGVDGSPASDAAIAFAFEEAALRHADLIAVHAWSSESYGDAADTRPVEYGAGDDIETAQWTLLLQRLTQWRKKFPAVGVHPKVVRGRATPALLELGEGAQLLAVGTRGRGFTGNLLGSTSNALTTYCECPVVVVRPHTYP